MATKNFAWKIRIDSFPGGKVNEKAFVEFDWSIAH